MTRPLIGAASANITLIPEDLQVNTNQSSVLVAMLMTVFTVQGLGCGNATRAIAAIEIDGKQVYASSTITVV